MFPVKTQDNDNLIIILKLILEEKKDERRKNYSLSRWQLHSATSSKQDVKKKYYFVQMCVQLFEKH